MSAICFAMFTWVCQAQPPSAQEQLLFCDGYKPIIWSRLDTRLTKEQVDARNRLWLEFCAPKASAS